MHLLRKLKQFRPKQSKNSENVNNSHPPNNHVPDEAALSFREPSNATSDAEQLENIDVPTKSMKKLKETTASGEFEDLWEKAEERLI